MDSGFYSPAAMASALLSDQTPLADVSAGTAGTSPLATRGDHRHQRFSSIGEYTLGADGTLAVVFTRTFASKPVIALTPIETSSSELPVYLRRGDFTQDAQNNYTGVLVRGYRSQLLPALTSIILIGPLISALANFNVFGGSAAGGQFSLLAFLPTSGTT